MKKTLQNMLKGAASIFDILPARREDRIIRKYLRNYNPNPELQTLEADWNAVGRDMQAVLGDFEKARKYCKDSKSE